MTAQTTTRTPAAGTRVAPMIVVIIAILAFAAGLALAQVVAPGTASCCRRRPPIRSRSSPMRRSRSRPRPPGTWPGGLPEPQHRRRVRDGVGSGQRRSARSACSRRVETADVGRWDPRRAALAVTRSCRSRPARGRRRRLPRSVSENRRIRTRSLTIESPPQPRSPSRKLSTRRVDQQDIGQPRRDRRPRSVEAWTGRR